MRPPAWLRIVRITVLGKHYLVGVRLTGETRRVPGAVEFVMVGELLDTLPMRPGMVTWPTRKRRDRR